MMMKRLVLLSAAALLCGNAAAATFHTIEAKTITGELQSVDARGVMTIRPAEGALVKVPSDELMQVAFAEDREPDEPLEGVILYLPGGYRICGTLVKGSQTHVEVESRSLGQLKLSLESLLAVEFRRAGEQLKEAAKMRAAMLENETKNDISFSANGDQMPGILIGFDREKIVLKAALGEMALEHTRLFGLSFAARRRPAPPPTLLAVVRCTDGSHVVGKLMASKGGGLKLTLCAGPEVEIDEGGIIALSFKNGKLVYLSDLKPAAEVYKPYFAGDHTWPYQPDKNYDRKPIRLGGKAHRKGLGVFSGTTLTYDLGGGFRKFVSHVGIDDADVNHQGNVTVRVVADGKKVFEKAGLTRKGGPVKVELPMSGVKTLQLVVDFGENLHFGDLTDWAEAHVIR